MDDYAPIVEQGSLEEPTGLLRRMMGRREVPAVGVGLALVLTDKEGRALQQESGGEKAWARAVSWIKVDVAEHTLDFTVPFSDPNGRAGFLATMTISTKIVDPGEAASTAAASIKDVIEPVLSEAVAKSALKIARSTGEDPIAVLSDARRAGEVVLREEMPRDLDKALPNWIKGEVKSISAAFDHDTQSHYSDLVRRGRHGELSDADAKNEQRETSHTIAVQNQWREALAGHLSNPATRSFELVFANPTPENIARAVDQVNASEETNRQRVFQVLSSLIEADHINQTSELSDVMRQIVASVEIGEGREKPLSLTGSPDSQNVLEAEADTVEEPAVRDSHER